MFRFPVLPIQRNSPLPPVLPVQLTTSTSFIHIGAGDDGWSVQARGVVCYRQVSVRPCWVTFIMAMLPFSLDPTKKRTRPSEAAKVVTKLCRSGTRCHHSMLLLASIFTPLKSPRWECRVLQKSSQRQSRHRRLG